ncbi:MAG: B12-binding domain-containing radical SAM protein [Gammaproteobacteria bacterium]|nr:B12-binding domain-containing radical SAM protein [Gammaproteobacteria bacterium]
MSAKKTTFWQRWNLFRKTAAPSVAALKPFTLVFSFYSPDGTILSMPLACISAYVKQKLARVEIHVAVIDTAIGGEDHSVEGYVRRIARHRPDLVAISCMSAHWIPLDPYLRALKTHFPRTPVLVGGYQAILAPETTIAHPAVDYICIGDGEEPLTALIRRLRGETQGNVPGLWEQTASGKIVKSPPMLAEDLSAMPFPDYTLYEKNGSLPEQGLSVLGWRSRFVLPVMTGRGCPYRCTYCSNASLLEMWRGKGKYIRKYDPRCLVDELCRLRDRYQVGYFEFWDELFLANMKFAYHFLELYDKHIHLPFSILSRVEKMDGEFCQTAAKAGCHTVWFGVECGSESYRTARLGRKMTNEQIIVAAENARKAGIRRLTFNMVGMPFESRAHMLETLELNKTIHPEYFSSF